VQKVYIFTLLNVVQVCVCGCEVSLLCVCVYRCVDLKELAVSWCPNVTDVGITIVISNCSQLRVLNMKGLYSITGLCAVPELTLDSITLWGMILHQVDHILQRPKTGPYCEQI
jgi:hypothetical protein